MEVLISHNERFGLYSKYDGKPLPVLGRDFKKLIQLVVEQEWNWEKTNQLGCC